MVRSMLWIAVFFGMLPWNIPFIVGGYWGFPQLGVPIDNSWPQLFGDKSRSLLDLWSFQHFLVGVLIGHALTLELREDREKVHLTRIVVLTASIVCFWETWEFGAELGLGMYDTMIITFILSPEWFGGVEHWSNRLIADPALMLSGSTLGFQLATKNRVVLYQIVQVVTGVFFVVHVGSPDVMTIHHLIFG